jgi:hypothetical protein
MITDSIKIESHNGIFVLRDDKLEGGTKSLLMPYILNPDYDEYIYASPVYGAFQIALSIYCKKIGKKATIFCAKRKEKHPNTIRCIEEGANVIEVPHGYLNVVESKAKDYLYTHKNVQKLPFGANTDICKDLISKRMLAISGKIYEPDEIWCAIGSGTLIEGILKGTDKAIVHGVQVGQEYKEIHPRLIVHKYPKPFDKESKYPQSFQSMKNYDLKAWEFCNKIAGNKELKDILFWNVF